MTRNGLKIFDSDSHVFEPAYLIDQYIDPKYREALAFYAVGQNRTQSGMNATYQLNRVNFNRRLGSNEPSENNRAGAAVGQFRGKKPHPDTNSNPHERVRDMDIEGIDVDMILPSGINTFCSASDPLLELAAHRAYHRFMSEYCSEYPSRLTGVMMAAGRSVEETVKEIYRVGKERWVVGVFPAIPVALPLDDPSLDPIWAAAEELDLTICLHTFTWTPPYAPGSNPLDNWNNTWLARSAAHPWCGMRNMAAILGSGVLDRHTRLRVSLLEAGHGWLPYWLARIDEQAEMMPGSVPEGMKPIKEYVQSGRYFQSIELHEGELLTQQVIDAIGSDVLMFSSDYPHPETWFPEAVESFMNWGLSDEIKKKMLWDNPARCFARYEAQNAEIPSK